MHFRLLVCWFLNILKDGVAHCCDNPRHMSSMRVHGPVKWETALSPGATSDVVRYKVRVRAHHPTVDDAHRHAGALYSGGPSSRPCICANHADAVRDGLLTAGACGAVYILALLVARLWDQGKGLYELKVGEMFRGGEMAGGRAYRAFHRRFLGRRLPNLEVNFAVFFHKRYACDLGHEAFKVPWAPFGTLQDDKVVGWAVVQYLQALRFKLIGQGDSCACPWLVRYNESRGLRFCRNHV